MKVSKSIRSLSESSSSGSESESSDSGGKLSPTPTNKHLLELPQTLDKPSHGSHQSVINGQHGVPNLPKKKKPPSPETMSKMLGFEVKEAPRVRILKKKENGDSSSAGQPCSKRFRSERVEDLEQKWLLHQENDDWSAINSRCLNPYDIDGEDNTPPDSNDNNKPQGAADKFKMIGEQWGSMVTSYNENPSHESLAAKWPEYNTYKAYIDLDVTNGHVNSSYKHKRNSRDRKSKTRRQDRRDSRSAATQTESDAKFVSVGIQIANLPPSLPQSLASPEYYQRQAKEMKETYSSTVDGIDRVLAQTRICVFETLEAASLEKERTDPSSLSRKLNEVVQRCRQNLDVITKEFSRDGMIFLKDSFLVINMKLMSYLYHKLYLSRRSEVAGAKTIIDDFLMKKLPAENQMSQRVTSAVQFYATYMEYLAKSLNYSERADNIIESSRSEYFEGAEFKEMKPDCSIHSLVSLINVTIAKLNRTIEDADRHFS